MRERHGYQDMKLVIGGCAQGKLDYVLTKYHLQEDMVWNGMLPDDKKVSENPVIINHFHKWVKQRILDGGCPEKEVLPFLDRYEDCIIVSDEIGNGIVPMEAFEREYRESVGRILVQLADRAKEVERVICGIGQKIK